ncbi:hypothetical protein L202_04067 [Cryptococcus amylolentus CBS 6039]|uniref:Uncharacterized protein n=2 Tax=Cryptococcus amylolentus TaxID=104669 RepID=A0A1E3HPZ7_9TREE|nr:hypothetical protein L202_04067 [Cryptococcus amylolentus CBS 6039]ODN78430.1 hypothetical protein L202_04067 [Cryptococcus amylolentus CBS 6039]ODO06982.1 hypothetical protein I350_04347 [Cryptococcus amylolentus CBS 6273]
MTHDVATPNSKQQALNSTPVAVTISPVSAFFPTTQSITPQPQAPSVAELASRMADLMSSVSTMGDEAFEAAYRSAFYEQPASSSTTPCTPGALGTPTTPTTPTTPPTLSAPGSPKRKRDSVDEEGHKCSAPTTHSSPSPTLSSTTCGASLGRSWCGASCCSAKRPCIQRYIAQTCGRYVKRQINRVPSTGCTSPTRRRSPKPRRVHSLPSLYFPPPSPSPVPTTPVPVHVSLGDDCEDPADAFLAAFMSKMGIASAEEQDEDMVVEIESGSSVGMVMA